MCWWGDVEIFKGGRVELSDIGTQGKVKARGDGGRSGEGIGAGIIN